MNNIELNTALLNMGYRYMGIQKDKSHVWGKPIGYIILVVYVTPDMGDVKLSSLWCRICKEDGEEMTLTYASTKYSECAKFVPIDNATYNDFIEFIKYAEYNAHIETAICTTNSQMDFSFRNDLDYESQKFIKY